MTEVAAGLAGVIAAHTRKSHVDGEAGRLYIAGYNMADLAEHAAYEEVVFLLWHDRLPSRNELREFTAALARDMSLSQTLLSVMRTLPQNVHPLAALRTLISLQGLHDPEADHNEPAADLRKAQRLVAKTPSFAAAWARLRQGREPLEPRPELSLVANFLWMLNGQEPTPNEIRAINVYLVLLADHSLNPSTFTSRVVASTDSDIYSAATAALGALKGPKHGGANEAAMNMFIEIADVERVDHFFREQVKGRGRRIMGMGHRVYKVTDPRADILRRHAERLAQDSGNLRWYAIAARLEALALADPYFIERKVCANVDYYSAILLYTLGIAPDMMPLLFAVSRMAGWTAHILEQRLENRLIHPEANYVGETGRAWLPIEQRG